MNMEKNKRSCKLAYILRHDKNTPLEEGGWLPVDYLIAKENYSLEELRNIVSSDEKCRFELDEENLRVRALYGHSLPVDLKLECKTPPAKLYHGTSKGALNLILDKGLLPMSRIYVHLSDNTDLAEIIGERHGEPIVLKIDAQKMIIDGYNFYNPVNRLWLVSNVPAQYLALEHV